jgi:pimeloyl-ACP methyl ester carboxylesterase
MVSVRRSVLYCTAACLVALFVSSAGVAGRSQASVPTPGEATFSIFLGGREIGREQVNLARAATGWVITATSRIGPPIDVTVSRFELKYSDDWQPIELRAEGQMRQASVALATSFGLTTAVNEITQNAVTNSKTDQVSARTIVLPNNFFAAYEALAARLSGLAAGAELRVYVAPQGEIKLTVRDVTPGQYQTPAGVVTTNRYSIAFHNPAGELPAEVSVDDKGRLARLEIPSATLLVARQDLASVATRVQTARNPTDADVRIPSSGFSLAGTLTTPPEAAGRMRSPAVVLVAGSGPVERDAVLFGIPIFAQLAGDLARRGFIVLRYDKRGVGQSGGRVETVTLREYADDVIAAVKWLEKRKGVDKRRIVVVGHSEGGAVAMLAASREKKISALVLLASVGTRGVDLVLEQQQYSLDILKTAESERTSKVELQKRIVEAAMTGTGMEDLPPEIRERAASPWYRSLLLFDPAEVIPRIKQPILILYGELDKQVPPHHAKRLTELATARKKGPPPTTIPISGLNHLLVPAKTGDITEYASLTEKQVSPEVARHISEWLNAPTATQSRKIE